MKICIFKHSELSKVVFEHYENSEHALRDYVEERLAEEGFDLGKHIEVKGDLNYSEFVRFEQEDG